VHHSDGRGGFRELVVFLLQNNKNRVSANKFEKVNQVVVKFMACRILYVFYRSLD
jgi:hypothetical protein